MRNKQTVSVNQIAGALGLRVQQLNRLTLKIGQLAGESKKFFSRSLSWEQAITLALVEMYNQCADVVVEIQFAYDFILSQVQAFGAYIDSYAMVIDQSKKQIAFSARREAADLLMIEGSVLTGGAFVIIAIHPLCRKLAALFDKAYVPVKKVTVK